MISKKKKQKNQRLLLLLKDKRFFLRYLSQHIPNKRNQCVMNQSN